MSCMFNIFTLKPLLKRAQQNMHIQPETHMTDIPDIQPKPCVPGNLVSATHLRQTGNPRPHPIPLHLKTAV